MDIPTKLKNWKYEGGVLLPHEQIDRGRIEQFARRASKARVLMLLDELKNEVDNSFKAIALILGDASQAMGNVALKNELHKLKGTTANLGLSFFSNLVGQLEYHEQLDLEGWELISPYLLAVFETNLTTLKTTLGND